MSKFLFKGQAWYPARIIVGIIIALIFLFAVSKPYLAETVPKMGEEIEKISYGCSSNADCKEGVCVNAECICFVDAQCSGSCDKSIGVCK